MSRQNWLILAILSILWGGAYLVIEVTLRSFSPVVVVFGRVALAAVVLLPLALHRDALRPLLKHPWWVLLTVLLQATAPLLLLTHGQQWLSAGLTGILIGAQPLFVALLSVRFDPASRVWRSSLASTSGAAPTCCSAACSSPRPASATPQAPS